MTAIEPPDYFPGLPYAALLVTVSSFVIDSRYQYSRQSFQNRARLRTPDGFQWISVPLTNGQFGRSIGDTRIDYDQNWISRHLKALRFNYASTPFYDHYIPDIEELLQNRPETLGSLTEGSVRLVHRFLNCRCTLRIASSRSAADDAPEREDGTRLVQLEDRIPTNELDSESALKYGRRIRVDMSPYRQNFKGFESGMSVLDLLFNHGPAARGRLERAVTTLE